MEYNSFEMKRAFGNIMHEGAENLMHDDDGDYYPNKPALEKHYSGVLMLSDDYEGGDFFFEHHDKELRLEAGDLIMFRGDADNLHGVRKVTKGPRVNLIFFFRDTEHERPRVRGSIEKPSY
jgi:predicted 2-oxoglutarate/Fe(II)-dependent dioxygenase YbiX